MNFMIWTQYWQKKQRGEILIVGAVHNLHSGKVEFLPETFTNFPEKKN